MIMKPALTLDDAKQLLAAAEEEARRQGWEVVISVLNDGGRIIAVHRMDGARPGNDDISLGKANTAAKAAAPASALSVPEGETAPGAWSRQRPTTRS